MSVPTRARRIAPLMITIALLIQPLLAAEITDSPEPFEIDNLVVVGVTNADDVPGRGTIEVVAILVDGSTVSKTVPYDLGARQSDSFVAAFKGEVDAIVSVQITEGPDPIPQ